MDTTTPSESWMARSTTVEFTLDSSWEPCLEELFAGEDFNYLLDDSWWLFPSRVHPSRPNTMRLCSWLLVAGAVVDTSNYDGVLIYPQQTAVKWRVFHCRYL